MRRGSSGISSSAVASLPWAMRSQPLQDGGASTTLMVQGPARITGDINMGGGNDRIVLAAGSQITGAISLFGGDDSINIGGTVTGNLFGGAGNDVFDFENTGRLSGNLTGGAGTDTLRAALTGNLAGGNGCGYLHL